MTIVIAGLDPAIHRFQKMDARDKPGHDGKRAISESQQMEYAL